jgi:hypothetical protein
MERLALAGFGAGTNNYEQRIFQVRIQAKGFVTQRVGRAKCAE